MTFNSIPKRRFPRLKTQTVSVFATNGKLCLSISGDVYRELGTPEAVEVYKGSGGDEGRIMLKPTSDLHRGYRCYPNNPQSPNGQYRVNLPIRAAATKLSSVDADFYVRSDGSLVVHLPDVPKRETLRPRASMIAENELVAS